MKTITLTIAGALLAASQAFCQSTDPAIPVGTLNVNQSMVRQGVAPNLNWVIEYPNEIDDIIEVDEPDEEIVTKKKLRVQVYVIGVGITDQYGREYSATSYLHYSSYGWKHIFSGKGSQVDPTRIYDDRILNAGETIRFAAKFDAGSLGYLYNDSRNVKVLKNGDLPPGNAAGYTHQASAAEYLRPYIKNGLLALGPLDIIYAAELTHTDPNHYGFDLQDTIILVRFTKVP